MMPSLRRGRVHCNKRCGRDAVTAAVRAKRASSDSAHRANYGNQYLQGRQSGNAGKIRYCTR